MAEGRVVWTAKLDYLVLIIRTDTIVKICNKHVEESETRVEKKMLQIYN